MSTESPESQCPICMTWYGEPVTEEGLPEPVVVMICNHHIGQFCFGKLCQEVENRRTTGFGPNQAKILCPICRHDQHCPSCNNVLSPKPVDDHPPTIQSGSKNPEACRTCVPCFKELLLDDCVQTVTRLEGEENVCLMNADRAYEAGRLREWILWYLRRGKVRFELKEQKKKLRRLQENYSAAERLGIENLCSADCPLFTPAWFPKSWLYPIRTSEEDTAN